ncbi:MAG: transporter substrate-binding domain-containing protein [Oscillospiraceae bacterium]|nr:transporter substrate-binding domain-containing protein [Oscillospiraceae bacterium]
MKKIIALALAMIMALSFTACGGEEETVEKSTIDKILEQGYITVAISPDFAPSEFKDPATGEVMGTDVEFAKYVAQYISEKYGKPVELKIEEMDFKSCQAAVSTGAVHFSLNGYAATDERRQNYICAGPYAILSQDDASFHGALVKKGLEIKTPEDFKGLKIACQQASLQYNLAMAQLPLDEMEEIEFITNLSMGAMMVTTDKVDAVIMTSGSARPFIAQDDTLELAEFHFEYESEGTYALVNINETELGELVNEALRAANEALDYDALHQEMTDKALSMGVKVN